MALTIVARGVAAATINPIVLRNASITDATNFLGSLRVFDRDWTATGGLAYQVGRSLRRGGVTASDLRRTSQALEARSTDLRSVLVDEVLWYIRVGVLQLRHATEATKLGHPTLGRATSYYASYYFANALCRLAGRVPLYLREFERNNVPGPMVVLSWNGLVPARGYYISKHMINSYASHKALWATFFAIFEQCSDAMPDLAGAVTPVGGIDDETIERNDLTYLPWAGFRETASETALQASLLTEQVREARLATAIHRGGLSTLNALATDPFHGVFARAALRGLLLARFLSGTGQNATPLRRVASSLRTDLVAQLDELTLSHSVMRLFRDELAS